MNEKLNVFILAAGHGERLRPITDYIPKPLLPILGKPILESILEKVSSLSVDRIGINLHYKKEIIENWIKQSDFSKRVELFPEDPVLGTGGALKNAEKFLSNSTFLVYNSDILSEIDLKNLVTFHLSSKNLLTLAVHDYHKFNKLVIDEEGFLKGLKTAKRLVSASVKNVAFTGIAVYSTEFMKFLPSGVSSVVDAWLRAVTSGYRVGTFDVSGCSWNDIGKPITYAQAVLNELRKNGETVYIHPSVYGCRHVEMDGYLVIEKENIFDEGTFLRNCIMLPGGTTLSPPLDKGGIGGVFENCILGPNFKIDLSETEMLGLSAKADAVLIGTGGSDKEYYRVKKYKGSAVLMKCLHDDKEFQRHIEYTRFFQRYAIPVPKLIDVETEKRSALFEDMGDLSLYSWLKCQRAQKQIEKVYKKVIDVLVLIHTVATEHVSECPLLENRVFDYDYLRWETGYFIERFVNGIRNIKIKNLSVLNDEFHRLALKADSFPKTVVHRDFQPQNIMITKGKIPRLVDYQGARIGPPAYDVVSILWDPYYRLEDNVRQQLLDYYVSVMKKRLKGRFSKKDFIDTILSCRFQRHMQSLGAYGFLSAVKGKKYFLKHVPEGIRLLKEDILLSKEEYPELYKLVMRL
ncbi:MAG: phosphotransferase [Nitrospirota bacterium]|nr:phosphotransferase [Nitrospirota bacterium]